MKTQAEYIWIDGTEPTRVLRSKTRIIDYPSRVTASQLGGDGLAMVETTTFPDWGFDGSSTGQADGSNSDCVLKPVCFVKDPLRPGEPFAYSGGGIEIDTEIPNYLVLCEVFNGDGVTPHPTNTRAELSRVLEAGAKDQEPWFGIEQEYTLYNKTTPIRWPLGFPYGGEADAQGPYYCGVGAGKAIGRPLIERHTAACIAAGLLIAGTNAEVMPGQWEFQIGAADPLTIGDHLWLARWLLNRLGEDYGIEVSLDPKPVEGDWNGAGAHTNFSTAAMRVGPGIKCVDAKYPRLQGIDAIKEACLALGEKASEHIAVYGAGIEKRLTGKHETCSYQEFRFGVADRGASIRIPRHVKEQGFGYLEDRRPCANADPYVVMARILKTVCGIE